MANDMISSQPLTDQRGAAFARLAARVIETLNAAVEKRREEGKSLTDLAGRIGCHRSLISRTLNGTTRNLTLRTISDILWAADFEPQDFSADAIEHISPNWISSETDAMDEPAVRINIYPTKTLTMSSDHILHTVAGSVYKKPEIEIVVR